MYSPSIDQAVKLQFQDNFLELAQEKTTKLSGSRAVIYLPSEGKTQNMGRIGPVELSEVAGRNPDKSYGDYDLDNRQLTKRRFTRTITIDALYDVNELLKDPESDIIKQLVNAKNRVIDRVICEQAAGAVLCGAPNAAAVSVSAADDGVITHDATSGFTYGIVQLFTQKFINNALDYEMFRGAVLCISGKENTQLMQEPQFINNDYISGSPVAEGKLSRAGLYEVKMFAGSENGGITVTNPILAETSSQRTCLVLAPESVALSMEIGRLEVERNKDKVNSMDITIDLWINAMRTEGVRVQKVTTLL